MNSQPQHPSWCDPHSCTVDASDPSTIYVAHRALLLDNGARLVALVQVDETGALGALVSTGVPEVSLGADGLSGAQAEQLAAALFLAAALLPEVTR